MWNYFDDFENLKKNDFYKRKNLILIWDLEIKKFF